MNRTIAQLIPRFAKIGLELTPVPDTTPQRWTVRDPLTAEVEDFGGGPPGGYGDDLATIRIHLYRSHSPMQLRETRVHVLFEQGKSMAQTAEILGCTPTTVTTYRRKLRLPSKDPRGPRKPRAGRVQSTPASVEAERLLRAAHTPAAAIARQVGLSRQRVCQIRDALGLPGWTRLGARRQQLRELVAQGIVDQRALVERLGCLDSQLREDARAEGLAIENEHTRAAARRAKVAQLSQAGEPAHAIADRLHVPVAVIVSDRSLLGLAAKRHRIGHKLVQARRVCVAELAERGLSQRAIRERLGIAQAVVSADLKVLRAKGALA